MLEILYQDDFLVAINKPAGLLVHRSMLDPHATEFAMQMLRDELDQHVYPIHRLDRPTSGLLLFALDPHTAQLMGEQFAAHLVQKRYLAVVRGYLDTAGVCDYPLVPRFDKLADRDRTRVKEAQQAITHYRPLAKVELPYAVTSRYPTSRYSLMALSPLTGRKHQLRRHMEHLCHPIIGDTTHGEGRHNLFFREHYGIRRLLLHAQRLTFMHPHHGGAQILVAAPDLEMTRLFAKLGWDRGIWEGEGS